jgi:hypothetical protein
MVHNHTSSKTSTYPDGVTTTWYADGCLEWRRGGKLSNVYGGPAVEHSNGMLEYFENDERHNLTGPAIVTQQGEGQWYVRGRAIAGEIARAALASGLEAGLTGDALETALLNAADSADSALSDSTGDIAA